MKLNYSLVIFLLLLFAGCRPRPAEQRFKLITNFDDVARWGCIPPTFSVEKAHSGRYSIKVGGGVEFSAVYSAMLGDVAPFLPNKARVKGWAYFPTGRVGESNFVIQILRADPSRGEDVWKALPINLQVKRFGLWVPVSGEIDLPDGLARDDQFKMYIWHPEKEGEAFYFDDLEIELLP